MSDNFYLIAGITSDYLKGPIYPVDYRNNYNGYGIKSEEFYINKLLTEEEIEAKFKAMDKDMLVKWQILSEDFIERHLKDLNLVAIVRYQVLSENFMRKYCIKHTFEPGYQSFIIQTMLRYQNLSTEFILSIIDYIERFKIFHLLCTFQHIDTTLLERLLNDYTNTKHSGIITRHLLAYQEIPEEMIHNNPYMTSNKIYREEISKHQNLPRDFYEMYDLPIESSILSTSDDWKREILGTGRFDTFADYFVGYKIVRADNYSDFNYRFKYDPGEYHTFSDYSYNNIGAGFGILDEEAAKDVLANRFKNAAKFKIIEVRVKYEDITYVNQFKNGNVTIRAKQITV